MRLPALCLTVASFSVVLSACLYDPNTPPEWEWGVLESDTIYQCVLDEEERFESEIPLRALNLARGAVWLRRKIPVCWEDSSFEDTPEQEADRALVERAVRETWEAALDIPGISEAERVEFVGWEPCSEGDGSGIRIEIADKGPHVDALGDRIAGRSAGMTLNFTYGNWGELCANSEEWRRYCNYAIAVHEFGHALGFAHEQNREDAPDSCTDSPQGSDGDVYLGEWDLETTMNYCNPVWNNGGALSEGDVWGVQLVYYPEAFDFSCVPETPAP